MHSESLSVIIQGPFWRATLSLFKPLAATAQNWAPKVPKKRVLSLLLSTRKTLDYDHNRCVFLPQSALSPATPQWGRSFPEKIANREFGIVITRIILSQAKIARLSKGKDIWGGPTNRCDFCTCVRQSQSQSQSQSRHLVHSTYDG